MNKKKKDTVELTGMKNGASKTLTFGKREDEYVLLDKEEINPDELVRITIDSVYSKTAYRVLVSRIVPHARDEIRKELILENLQKTLFFWSPEESFFIDGKMEEKNGEKIALLPEGFALTEEELVEGRVFLILNGYKYDITKYARQEAKKQYEKVISRE
ncbi:MAG: hypothetical protein ACFFD4_06900 [Candidatus Odinarchaeota archaeon]